MEILEETVTLSEKRQYLTTRRRRDLANDLFIWALRSIALGAIALVLAIILIIIVKGAPAISIEFLTSPPTEGMTSGGIYPMIRGSVLLLTGTFLIALPLGILGGIFLIVVTHNMQQAARVSDYTAFFMYGELIEYGHSKELFLSPKQKATEDYISGRFG